MPKRPDPFALRFRINVGATHPLRPYLEKIEENRRPGEILELATMGLQFRGIVGQTGQGAEQAGDGIPDDSSTAELVRQVARLADAMEAMVGGGGVLVQGSRGPGRSEDQAIEVIQEDNPTGAASTSPVIEPEDPRLDALDRW